MFNMKDIRNAKWSNSSKTMFECEVDVDGIDGPGEFVPFAVGLDDTDLSTHALQILEWGIKNKSKIKPFVPDVDKIKLIADSVINNIYTEKVNLAVPYTPEEKETFKIQEEEAKLYLSDNTTIVPHLEILANINGVSVFDLATKIIEKSKIQNLELFRLLSLKQKAKSDILALNIKSKTYDKDINSIVRNIKW